MVSAFLVGILFALGLGISGMTEPQRVISFLDVFGNWNPSLLFVMVGAIAVHAISYRLIMKRRTPLFAAAFERPKRTDLDRRLIAGAALFGIGWGLAGYCPAPAIVSLAGFSLHPVLFTVSMLFGMALFLRLDRKIP